MRVLIASADTGGGHRSAMRAVAEALRAEGAEVLCAPRSIERTHAVNHAFCALYNAMLRHRPGWVAPYAALLERLRPNERAGLYRALVRPYLVRLLERARPDAVVSVHPMANHHLARGLDEMYGPAAPPLVTVVTDPVGGFWPAWVSRAARLTCVATERAAALVREIAARDGPADDFAARVRVTGLPVAARFYAPPGRPRAAVLGALGLDPDPARPTLFAIAGWAGESGSSFLDAIDAALRSGTQVVAVCGHARALRERAARRLAGRPGLALLGFVPDPRDLMGACDAVFTKPGALTIFEAIAIERPIIVNALRPLMPQEAPTAAWLVEEELGAEIRRPADLPAALRSQLGPAHREALRAALRRHRRPDAARAIARAVIDLAAPTRVAAEPAREPVPAAHCELTNG